MRFKQKLTALIILDGWGVAKPNPGNAVSQAQTPFFDDLVVKYPSLIINASGEAVGLPAKVMGNSEVGHLTLGSGRICDQSLQKINKAITDKSFFTNPALLKTIKHVKDNKSSLHIMGLVSDGRVHSSLEHLKAVLVLAQKKKIDNVFVHCFLDGRDTLRNEGVKFVQELEDYMKEIKIGKIVSLSGRFYAMDRDNHWERTAKAYEVIVKGQGPTNNSAVEAIEAGYAKENFDEEFIPTIITDNNKPMAVVKDNDAIIFFNYRADRARQITKAFVLDEFDKFERGRKLNNLLFAGFTLYENDLPMEVAFPEQKIDKTLGQILSENNLKQLRIAETEKYAHVTYFFNGGKEEKNQGEDHIIIPSPRVDSYATEPAMSANQIADQVVKDIETGNHNFILINFANADMVGHTGNLQAAIEAIETVDKCLAKVVKKVLDKQGIAIVTADHGNAEEMLDLKTNTILKEHSINPVPFIVVGQEFEGQNLGQTDIPGSDLSVLKPNGNLYDVAPTILKIMDIEQPDEMTGQSLI